MKTTGLCLFVVLSLITNNKGQAETQSSDLSDNSGQIRTLEQALVTAYDGNPELRRARADLRGTDELRSQAFSGWLPSVTANGSLGEQHTSISGIKDSGDVNSESIEAIQPLYRGGNYSRVNQSESLIKSGRANLQNSESEVLLAAITAYMNLITNRALLDLAQKKEAVLYKEYDDTKKRYKAGELTRTDITQAISRASGANAEISNTEVNLEQAKAEFERIIGDNPGDLAFPNNLPVIPQSFDLALNEARNNNPTVVAAKFAEDAADQAVEANKGAIEPSLNLAARAEHDDNYSLAENGNYNNSSVTVNLTVPLYESGAEYSKVRQSKDEASARRYDYLAAVRQIDDEVKTVWRRIYTSNQIIDSNQLAVNSADIALSGIRKEEQLGVRTLTDVLDAEQDLFTVKTQLLNAKRDQIIAYYTLLARIGKLTAADLKLPVKYYDPERHYENTKHKFIGF